MRRPQKSELMRSPSCQSGPASSSTTFLPAFAITEAKTEPDAPAPTMTTSTFSLAMSPAPGRCDMRLVGNAEMGIALHGPVDDIDGVGPQQEVDETRARAFPALELALAHEIDEVVLLGGVKLREAAAAVPHLARALDRAERRAVEIGIGWTHIHDAGFEQGLLGRDRNLLIDELGDAGLLGARNQRFANGAEGCGLLGRQR